MAKPASKQKSTTAIVRIIEQPKKNKGIHAKSATSALKASKKYKKPYRGQGRSR
jgi:hypothetical protein